MSSTGRDILGGSFRRSIGIYRSGLKSRLFGIWSEEAVVMGGDG